jgi:7,8-dihydropterin-6-yl-methyl-4-(beta-D-ribofuranosyl)aminobenzene 5'-phosphate synthase
MKSPGKVRITLLAENRAHGTGILGEHGLAVWIETPEHRVLFDTGQGLALQNNAEMLGIDLASADSIVLSHGHYDHVGGLKWVLAQAPEAVLHMHPDATEAKFSGSGAHAHRVSIPFVERPPLVAGLTPADG